MIEILLKYYLNKLEFDKVISIDFNKCLLSITITVSFISIEFIIFNKNKQVIN
jgi:hypothetical protein